MDDAICALLGLPSLEALQERLLAEADRRGADGISPREMHKRNPDATVLDWMRAGAALHRAGKLAHTWTPLKADPVAAQESRYTIPQVQPCL